MQAIKRITFIGAGAMAESIITGLIKKEMIPPGNIMVTNRMNDKRLEYLTNTYGIKSSRKDEQVLTETDLIVLAMKPKDAHPGLVRILPFVQDSSLIVSVMAGITTDFIEKTLQKRCAVIRTMPNTSSEIGRSSTTLSTGNHVTINQRQAVELLFQAIGTVTVIRETDMDTTTALAGSGPAYLYYIAEAMNQAATSLGLDEEQVRLLVADTMIGAGHMMKQSTEDLHHLRKKVTSPGGTTEAGLNALMKRHVDEAFKHCILDASKRSSELAKQFSTFENSIK